MIDDHERSTNENVEREARLGLRLCCGFAIDRSVAGPGKRKNDACPCLVSVDRFVGPSVNGLPIWLGLWG